MVAWRKTTPLRRDIKQVMMSNGIRTSIQQKTDQPTLMENLNLPEQDPPAGQRSVPFQVDIPFLNSLIIHQVKTEKITAVKEVWVPGLN